MSKSQPVNPHKLTDGLYKFGQGKKARWMHIGDGIMWIHSKIIPGFHIIMWDHPIVIDKNKVFLRARDIISEIPSHKEAIEALAAKHEVSV